MGAILVNINPAYRTHELEYVLDQAGIRMIVAAPSFKTSDYAAMIEEVRGDVPGLEQVVLIGTDSWDDLLGAAPTGSARSSSRRSRPASTNTEAINIQYTSGTTGFPKGATLSHRNILNNGYFVGELCRYTEADRVCIPVPFYHCFGMVMGNLACSTHGAAMVIPAPGFDPAKTLQACQDEKAHLALRRADDVHRRVVAAELRRLRHVEHAHRHHGRLAVPGRADEEGHRPRASTR